MEKLVTGKDYIVRGANVRVVAKGKPSSITRPIQKLYPLEEARGGQKGFKLRHLDVIQADLLL